MKPERDVVRRPGAGPPTGFAWRELIVAWVLALPIVAGMLVLRRSIDARAAELPPAIVDARAGRDAAPEAAPAQPARWESSEGTGLPEPGVGSGLAGPVAVAGLTNPGAETAPGANHDPAAAANLDADADNGSAADVGPAVPGPATEPYPADRRPADTSPADTSDALPGQPAVEPSAAAPPSITPTPSQTPPPTETPPSTETPTPSVTPTPGPESYLPVVPRIDGGQKARLRDVWLRGQAAGGRPDVFVKVGDSLTASRYFMVDLGCGREVLDQHEHLRPTLEFFRAAALPGVASDCGDANPFTARSLAAGSGWTAAQVLAPLRAPPPECPSPADTALVCELSRMRPSVALIMLGTNELHQGVSPQRFEAALRGVVDQSIAAGTVPVISTIPPRTDRAWAAERVGLYNGVIVALAAETGVPVVNLWRALTDPAVHGAGMAPDGIHLSVFRGRGGDLRPPALSFGYNIRNLTALQALDAVKRIVIDDGAPDA